jgi:flagellar biosynthetic protein FliQ
MTEQMVLDIGLKTLVVTMKVSAPALITTLVIGLLVSIFQAATQINEQNMVFIPKIVAMMAAIAICGPWILRLLMTFTIQIIQEIPNLKH